MADKYVKNNAGQLKEVAFTTTSAGAGDSGKGVGLNSAGQVDITMMPTGVMVEAVAVVASENLAAGDFVNLWSNAGTTNVRKADASAASLGKLAHGFVLSAYSSSQTATVYLQGKNTGLSGLTPGAIQFLSGSTAGGRTETAPSTSGYAVQQLGYAVDATTVSFEPKQAVELA